MNFATFVVHIKYNKKICSKKDLQDTIQDGFGYPEGLEIKVIDSLYWSNENGENKPKWVCIFEPKCNT